MVWFLELSASSGEMSLVAITTALVRPGCCSTIPYMEWLRNNRNLFLTVPEVEAAKIKVLADLVSDEGCLLVHKKKVAPRCVLV